MLTPEELADIKARVAQDAFDFDVEDIRAVLSSLDEALQQVEELEDELAALRVTQRVWRQTNDALHQENDRLAREFRDRNRYLEYKDLWKPWTT